MDYRNMKFKVATGCDHGGCCGGCCRSDHQLNTYDWLADVVNDPDKTDLVEVQFKNTRKGYYHNVNNLQLTKGDMVAVEASPGHDIGVVTLTGRLVALQIKKANLKSADDIKRIYRLAKPVDLDKYEEAKSRENDTMIQSRQIAKDLGLKMKIGDVEYQGDGNKAIFYYIADERVDFRQLIKVLADTFHVRIEMKQIGARQEAGRIGGTGPCGRELCCATWNKNFVSVNYEVDNYVEAAKRMPSKEVSLHTGDAEHFVFKTDILAGTVTYSTDKNLAANLVTITAERARAIIEMNRRGEKPDSLEEERHKQHTDKPIDLLANADLSRFDKSKRPKRPTNGKPKGEKRDGSAPQNGAPQQRKEQQRQREQQAEKRRQRPQQARAQEGKQENNSNRHRRDNQRRGGSPTNNQP